MCVATIVAVFSGCNKTTTSPFVSQEPSAEASASDTSGADTTASLNLAGAYASMDPDTVMLSIDGKDITWGDMFYNISYYISEIQSQGTQITDWSAIYSDELTYKDYVLNSATTLALQDAAIEYGAKELNVTLSDQDRTDIQTDWDAQVQSAGSEEAFIAQLEAQYSSKEHYTHIKEITYLAQECFKSMYGENGSNLTDAEIADYTAEDGYLMAKHILMLTTKTDSSGNSTAMTEEEKAAVKSKMEDILQQLKSYNGTDFDGYFDKLMNEYSEDEGGLASFPNGYLFQSGDMVTQFEEGTKALEVGKFSDLVETDYGYHIIYRIPMNYDITPMAYSNYGTYSLRYITAVNMFKAVVDTWLNSMVVSYSDQYKALDFNKIFAAG